MSVAKLAAAAGLVALALSGCGTSAKPLAGTLRPDGSPAGRGRVDDPRTDQDNRLQCLRAAGLSVTKVGQAGLQVGSLPSGPTIEFQPTPGAAEADLIEGYPWAQGAEVIGAALLYPRQGSDAELKTIEDCLAQGVQG